jgi:hypothetical protein
MIINSPAGPVRGALVAPPSPIPYVGTAGLDIPWFRKKPTPAQPSLEALRRLARATPDKTWRPADGLATARNAHFTNTPDQLSEALRGDFSSLEADVRMRDGKAVLAHQPWSNDGMLLSDWLTVTGASGRLLKLDIKDVSALDAAIRLVQEAKIPAERVMFNVYYAQGPRSGDLSWEQLKSIRQRMPESWISMDIPLFAPDIVVNRVIKAAERLGTDRLAASVEAQYVNETLVKRLTPHFTVNAWNEPKRYLPKSIDIATRRLRALGVNGMIDLRGGGWSWPGEESIPTRDPGPFMPIPRLPGQIS